ncbi:hypothetical protein D5S18_18930 [Nocardia panacis]|uniref:HEAT repeat domain-containing protein n=1 Tax=Nocardia panacis TaxID=2340916 RepID=A0A3A4KD13_9NOCA|nr:hypothetical protein [Nocardia panacis]RJO73325.1 hypothetical protein D5S18_18930 [Nocardia panacis]
MSVRFVPHTALAREEVEKLAEQFDWELYSTKAIAGNSPSQQIWLTPDRGAAVYWIEDDLLQVDYIMIAGPDRGSTVELVRERIGVHDNATMAELFDSTRDGVAVMNALRMLCVHCSGPFDPEMFALFRWAMNDPEPLVRRIAVFCAGRVDWEELDPLFAFLQEHDPEEEVRDEARRTIAERNRVESAKA